MEDTPQHIKNLQLKIWLSKPPMERLRQFLVDNDALYTFWKNAKPIDIKSIDELTDNSTQPEYE